MGDGPNKEGFNSSRNDECAECSKDVQAVGALSATNVVSKDETASSEVVEEPSPVAGEPEKEDLDYPRNDEVVERLPRAYIISLTERFRKTKPVLLRSLRSQAHSRMRPRRKIANLLLETRLSKGFLLPKRKSLLRRSWRSPAHSRMRQIDKILTLSKMTRASLLPKRVQKTKPVSLRSRRRNLGQSRMKQKRNALLSSR